MESAEFCGSPELEIFSARDLVFLYPAFVLNYYGGESVASVHTTDRVYNDIEDLQTNEAKIVAECGFDILSGDAYAPFFAFVNGVYAYGSQPIRWSIVDEHDYVTHGESKLTNVKPYSTHFIDLREYIDLNAILHGEKGTIELKHNFRGFFPRFVGGNFEDRHHTLNITHTYCDNSDVSDTGAYWGNTDERLYDSAVFAPLFLEHGQYTHPVFYPVYSPSAFSIDLKFYDAAGQRVGVVRGWRPLETSAEQFFFPGLQPNYRRAFQAHAGSHVARSQYYQALAGTGPDSHPPKIRLERRPARPGDGPAHQRMFCLAAC